MEIRVKGENPFVSTAEYHRDRERAPHLEQPVHRDRLIRTAYHAIRLSQEYNCKTLVDLGCGDGGLLSVIKPFYDKSWGYDFQPANVKGAVNDRKVDVHFLDFVNDFEKADLNADVAVMSEILEHLDKPHGFLRRLSKTSIKYLITSSPANESESHHDDGHVWVWDSEGFRNLFKDNEWLELSYENTDLFHIFVGGRR